MKLSTDSNGWTLTIQEDIKSLSQEQLHEVARLCNRHYVVIFRNQDLTVKDQMQVASSIGTVKLDHGKDDAEKQRFLIEPGVIRVTGEKNHTGKGGLFGHDEELDWHTHHANAKKRYPFVWLYAVNYKKHRLSYKLDKSRNGIQRPFGKHATETRNYKICIWL